MHLPDPLISIPIKTVFAHYDLGIVIGYIKQISKFPVDRRLSVQAEGCQPIVRAFEEGAAESRFWDDPRISLTPHAAAAGSGRAGRGDDLFLENLSRFVRAAPLLNEVSPRDLPGAASAPGTGAC